MAIVGFHLFDIDRVVSRTVAYAVLVVVLTLVYLLTVVTLQRLVPAEGSDLTVAASTLLVASAFAPLRRRLQYLVDRRFNRARVEATEVADGFAQQLRTEVDLGAGQPAPRQRRHPQPAPRVDPRVARADERSRCPLDRAEPVGPRVIGATTTLVRAVRAPGGSGTAA